MISRYFLNQNNKNNWINQFPVLIQARHGKSGKWGNNNKSSIFFSNTSGTSNPNRPSRIKGSSGSEGSSGGFGGNFDGGSDGSHKPRASSELLFFSTGKNYASYPLNHQIQTPQSLMKDSLKFMMKPAEVKDSLSKFFYAYALCLD